jgi:hypothetical protein
VNTEFERDKRQTPTVEPRSPDLKPYGPDGLASVLKGVGDLVARAEKLFRDQHGLGVPLLVAKANRKEIDLCLAEAEELIAKVREVHRV